MPEQLRPVCSMYVTSRALSHAQIAGVSPGSCESENLSRHKQRRCWFESTGPEANGFSLALRSACCADFGAILEHLRPLDLCQHSLELRLQLLMLGIFAPLALETKLLMEHGLGRPAFSSWADVSDLSADSA